MHYKHEDGRCNLRHIKDINLRKKVIVKLLHPGSHGVFTHKMNLLFDSNESNMSI